MSTLSQQEFDQLASILQKQAENGDATAMKRLGDIYYQGPSGDETNITAALPWWKDAADHGERSVAFKVGYSYLNGTGVQSNEKLALHYFLLSNAFNNDAQSQYCAGYCYENGMGCHTNKRKAISYYEQAALNGYVKAQWRLGALLLSSGKSDGLYWICCAHLAGVNEASEALDHFIANGSSKDAIDDEIRQIKRDGPRRYGRKHEYNRELSLLFAVLKWVIAGFFISMIVGLIVFGFVLEMEHFPILFIVLIIGLFGYLGYWIEDN